MPIILMFNVSREQKIKIKNIAIPKQSVRMLNQTIGHLYLGGKGKNKF